MAKKLHPDINRAGEEAARLWLRVQDAYEAGNVAELKALAVLAEKFSEAPPPSSMDALREQREILVGQIEAKLSEIDATRQQPPCTLRGKLNDEAWLAQRRREIEQQTGEAERMRAGFEAHLQTLLPEGANE